MTNYEWLKTLSINERNAEINHWFSSLFDGYDDLPEIVIDFFEWANKNHNEPLEKCPFKCEGCDRQMMFQEVEPCKKKICGNFIHVSHGYQVISGKYSHCPKSLVYETKEQATDIWNKKVRGDVNHDALSEYMLLRGEK